MAVVLVSYPFKLSDRRTPGTLQTSSLFLSSFCILSRSCTMINDDSAYESMGAFNEKEVWDFDRRASQYREPENTTVSCTRGTRVQGEACEVA